MKVYFCIAIGTPCCNKGHLRMRRNREYSFSIFWSMATYFQNTLKFSRIPALNNAIHPSCNKVMSVPLLLPVLALNPRGLLLLLFVCYYQYQTLQSEKEFINRRDYSFQYEGEILEGNAMPPIYSEDQWEEERKARLIKMLFYAEGRWVEKSRKDKRKQLRIDKVSFNIEKKEEKTELVPKGAAA